MSGSGAEDAERAFLREAPARRAALAAELTAAVAAAKTLTPDETVVLAHLLAHAGFRLDGVFFLPSYEALWEAGASYLPRSPLPPARARAAAKLLRRRGVLRDDPDGVVLAAAALLSLGA